MREASQGVSVKLTKRLMRVETTTTTLNCLSRSATKTCTKMMGRKTTTSTRVMDKAEKPISARPVRAASRLSMPLSRYRWMFSRITMLSSTRMPMMSDMASRVIRFSV